MTIKVSRLLQNARNVDAYSEEGAQLKAAMHSQGKTLLRALARELSDVVDSDVRISSNQGGIAVSGEVILHSQHLYVQLFDPAVGGKGLQLLYRSCASKDDYCGDQNHYVTLKDFADPGKQEQVLETMRRLVHRREALPA